MKIEVSTNLGTHILLLLNPYPYYQLAKDPMYVCETICMQCNYALVDAKISPPPFMVANA